jgi:hypothetical protein
MKIETQLYFLSEYSKDKVYPGLGEFENENDWDKMCMHIEALRDIYKENRRKGFAFAGRLAFETIAKKLIEEAREE